MYTGSKQKFRLVALTLVCTVVFAITTRPQDWNRALPATSAEPSVVGSGPDTQVSGWAAERLASKARRYAQRGPQRYDQPQEASDFFMLQRLAPGAVVLPLDKLRKALDGVRLRELAIQAGEASGQAAVAESWTEIGPGNIGGRTRGIVIDPTSPSIMYAAGVAGGVWKTTDGGASWTATDDFLLSIAVSSLAMDPTNPLVLYAGTGEGFFNSDSVRGLGIFKTTDGGATWNQLAGTVTGVPSGSFFRVNDIVISPANPSRIYAGTRFGVWKSTDAGATWSIMLANPFFISAFPATSGSSAGCLDLAIRTDTSPGDDVLLASFGSFRPDGLYRSTNSGATWMQVGTASDLNIANQGRMQIDIAPSDNDFVYVSMADNGDTGNPTGAMVNVFRSTDGGVTWSPRLNFFNPINPFLLSNIVFTSNCGGNSNNAQGWYDNIIKIDPVDPNIVWVGGIDLFRSNDGGANFGLTSYWWFDPSDTRYVHADQHALVFHPNYNGTTNQIMYSGSDGGISRSDNARAATTASVCGSPPFPSVRWTGLNNGYGVTQFYWGDASKSSAVFGGGTQDNGTLRVSSTTTPDSWVEIIGGDGGYFHIDPNNSNIMYGETQNFPTIRKSTNGGSSFSSATSGITDDDGLFITPFELEQRGSRVLWTGGSRAWRSLNGASSWSLGSPDLSGASTISAIAISHSDPNVVYLGYRNGAVAKTTNGLAVTPSWTVFDSASGLSSGFVSSVTVDPRDPDVAYATYSTFDVPHILRTMNGGLTWDSIDGPTTAGVPDIPVHHLAIRPCDSTQLFVGTELGTFRSDDDGVTWTPFNAGLAHTVVEKLDFQDADTLVAFTHGRGAFITTLAPSCSGACCNGVSCTDQPSESACTGEFFAGALCSEIDCVGACCTNGFCADSVAQSDCIGQGRTWTGGTTCALTQCTGACCDGVAATCTENVEQSACSEGGDTWFAGEDCESASCTGSCCETDGSCTDDALEASCTGGGGLFSAGAKCADAACPPLNQSCSLASQLECNGSVTFDNSLVDNPPNPLYSCGFDNFHDGTLWYSFVAISDEACLISCNSVAQDSTYAIYRGTCGLLTQIGCSEDDCGPSTFLGDLCVTGLTPGDTYLIQVSAWRPSDLGEYTLELTCPTSATPSDLLPDPLGINTQRTVGLSVPVEGSGLNTALRVTLDSLYDPGEPIPVNLPDFSAREGEVRYVNLLRDSAGDPVTTCLSSAPSMTFYRCATVGCESEYVDWAGLFGGETIHISGSSIVPDSTYSAAQLAESCRGNEASCSAVSATLGLVTARFGDVDDSGLVTVADVVLTVDVLKALPDSAWEYQCYVRKESPEPHIDSVGIADVVAHVDALKLMAYALNVPACP